ncbi:MAG: hypothetical protein ACXVBB_08120 [Isosphaeraceae bacterium]
MIQSLDDAWKWYTEVKKIANDMRHLAGIWDEPALETVLSRDGRLRHRTAADLKDAVNTILGTDEEDLNDLAVLVLFSVFEATVRARAKADVDRETALMRHPAVLSAIKNLKDSIENGSFAKITEAYKKMDGDLTTQVNQVRKFRNWVAHGRRDEPENSVDPKAAKGRLDFYLQRMAELEAAGEMFEAK